MALLLGANPRLTPAEVAGILIRTSDKVGPRPYRFSADQLCAPSERCTWNERLGYGRINVARALTAVLSPQPAITAVSSVPCGVSLFTGTNAAGIASTYYDPRVPNARWVPWFSLGQP